MLSDPLAVAASAPNPAFNFVLIKNDGYGSERYDSGTGYTLTINHTRGKSNTRHYVKLDKTVDATNPYTGNVAKQTCAVSLSVSVPAYGFDETAVVNQIKALLDTLNDADFTSARFIQFQS